MSRLRLNARWWKPILATVWVAGLMAYALAGTPLTPFHGDESTLIYMSRDFAYLFLERDLERVLYHDPPSSATEQQLRLLNGTVSKYLFGLAWHTAGFSITDLNEQWDWGADWTYNQQNGHAPSEPLLLTVRWSSAILLAAGVGLIFLIGLKAGGAWTACTASLYFALSPALLLNGRRAMMEGAFTAFSLLTVLAGALLIARPTLWRGLLLGLAAGLAVASKHTALFTVLAIFAGPVLHLIVQSLRARDDDSEVDYLILPYLVVAGIVAGAVFFALNPAWWGDPLGRARTVLNLRQDLLATQVRVFGGYTSLEDKAAGFLRQTFLAQPQYYEVAGWDGYIGDQIARYEASPWRGVSVGGTTAGGLLLGSIMMAGLWAAASGATWPTHAIRLLLAFWALVMVGSTLLLTPLEWQRYYLPVYPAVGLLAGLGIEWLLRIGSAGIRRSAHVSQKKEET